MSQMVFKAYREFCSLHSLTQIIKNATIITENTSTLLDHTLALFYKKLRSGVTTQVSY